jgi:hypothetical protein
MLDWLRELGAPLSQRKARLLAVACCRRAWPLLTDGRARRAVEAAERYADGQAGREELLSARAAAWDAVSERLGMEPESAAGLWAAARTTWVSSIEVWQASSCLADLRRASPAEQGGIQCATLRDLAVDPLAAAPVIPARWMAWDGGCLPALARALYEGRGLPEGALDPAGLVVLADALEEAGCDNGDVLSHLRQQGVSHYRGCWVVDLLLDKA